MKLNLWRPARYLALAIVLGSAVCGSRPAHGQTAQPIGLAEFSSPALGLTFYYNSHPGPAAVVHTEATGSRVYVYYGGWQPQQGQFVEVRAKPAAQSLRQAIATQLLAGYSAKDCFITVSPTDRAHPTQVRAVIAFSLKHVRPDQPWWMQSKCPHTYSMNNGVRYFFEDLQHPDHFLFFDLGQYPIPAGAGQTWADTAQVLS